MNQKNKAILLTSVALLTIILGGVWIAYADPEDLPEEPEFCPEWGTPRLGFGPRMGGRAFGENWDQMKGIHDQAKQMLENGATHDEIRAYIEEQADELGIELPMGPKMNHGFGRGFMGNRFHLPRFGKGPQ